MVAPGGAGIGDGKIASSPGPGSNPRSQLLGWSQWGEVAFPPPQVTVAAFADGATASAPAMTGATAARRTRSRIIDLRAAPRIGAPPLQLGCETCKPPKHCQDGSIEK